MIAALTGVGRAGKKWLRDSEAPSAEETARVNLLATMRAAMRRGRPHAAVAAFMKWAPQSDEVCLPITTGIRCGY